MKMVVLRPEQIHTGELILVNRQYPYREKENRTELLPLSLEEPKSLLTGQACRTLRQLLDTINGWEQITAVSGWRSIREQQNIYEQSLRENGREYTGKYVALPGHSEHQTGLAIDLGIRQEIIDFICPDFPDTGICQIFRQQAASFGWIERYPDKKEHITGIAKEPWHFRYVGTPHAEIMRERGMVLEEYIAFLKQFPYETTSLQGKSRKRACLPFVTGNCPCSSEKPGKKGMSAVVSYLAADPEKEIRLEIPEHVSCTVSGNNVDGYIVTEWRNASHEYGQNE